MTNPDFSNQERPLRRSEASTYLLERWGIRLKASTLAKLACIGGGPIFRHAARFPIYSPDDLDAFARSIISSPKRSTSDDGERGGYPSRISVNESETTTSEIKATKDAH